VIVKVIRNRPAITPSDYHGFWITKQLIKTIVADVIDIVVDVT
jgi:hypothetical protein